MRISSALQSRGEGSLLEAPREDLKDVRPVANFLWLDARGLPCVKILAETRAGCLAEIRTTDLPG